jgi:hypothetical protein
VIEHRVCHCHVGDVANAVALEGNGCRVLDVLVCEAAKRVRPVPDETQAWVVGNLGRRKPWQ